jgi:hypothetical protein
MSRSSPPLGSIRDRSKNSSRIGCNAQSFKREKRTTREKIRALPEERGEGREFLNQSDHSTNSAATGYLRRNML